MPYSAVAHAVLGAAIAAAAACTPEFPTPTWKGEYIEYAITPDTEVCQGSWVMQDAYVKALVDWLGVTLTRRLRFAFVTQAELDDFCFQEDILGCSYDGKAYSTRPVHYHELAHEVAKLTGHHGPSVFQEGYAEVFGNGIYGIDTRLPLEQVLRDFEHDGPNYYTAGLFVRFLIERDGLDTVLAFMRRTNHETSFSAMSVIFEEEFSSSLPVAMAEFEDYPTCSTWVNRLAVLECGLPAVPWQGAEWSASSTLDCGDPDVLGPKPEDGENLIWSARGLVIDEPGDYLAEVGAGTEGTAGVRITRCGSCWDSVDFVVKAGASRIVNLPSGRYYVTFIKELEEPGDIALTLTKPL